MQNFNNPLSPKEKKELSVNLGKDDCDQREIVLDGLNEKFFMFEIYFQNWLCWSWRKHFVIMLLSSEPSVLKSKDASLVSGRDWAIILDLTLPEPEY